MLARAAVRNTGACAEGSHKDGEQLVGRLREMLEPGNLERYRDAARRFAQKYARLDEGEQVGRMVGRVEELVASGRQGDKGTGGGGDTGTAGECVRRVRIAGLWHALRNRIPYLFSWEASWQ
jgi:hypothetical protein